MIILHAVKYIFVHHTGVSFKLNADQCNATGNDHKQRFNMLSSLGSYVGYNYEIAANGQIRQARQEGEVTAAVIAFNLNSVSICLDGNFDVEMPTQGQCDALARLILQIMTRHAVQLENIHPHRFACGNPPGSVLTPSNPPYKTCYGNKLSDTWAQDLVVQYQKKSTVIAPTKDVSKNGC